MKMPSKEEATASSASSSTSVSDDEYVHPDADHLIIRKDRLWPEPSKIEDEPLPQPKEWPEGIVISGISGRYPESDNLEEFWDKLIQGVELISSDDRRWPVGECKFNFFFFFPFLLILHLHPVHLVILLTYTHIHITLLNLLQTVSLSLEAHFTAEVNSYSSLFWFSSSLFLSPDPESPLICCCCCSCINAVPRCTCTRHR